MPRGPRVDAPGSVHHVMVRGIERRDIFRDDPDRLDLLMRLDRILPESDMDCPGWAFMPNHVHLLLRTGSVPLSRVMARLNTGYARYFNGRHERSGHLFQNRFLSRLVEDEADLVGLVRYVHLNPLRARVVADLAELERYPWTGHSALMGVRAAWEFESVGTVLALWSRDRREARARVREWMGAEATEDSDAVGDDSAPPSTSSPSRSASQRVARTPADLDDLVKRVCRQLGVDPGDLHAGRGSRATSRARAAIVRLAIGDLGISASEVSRRLGLSAAGTHGAFARGQDVLASLELDPK